MMTALARLYLVPLILAASAILSCGTHSPSSEVLHVEENPAADALSHLMRMWVTGDTSGLAGLVTRDAVYEDRATGVGYRGIAGFAERIQHLHSWAGDVKLVYKTYKPELTAREFSAGEWVLTGIQEGPITDRLAFTSNRSFKLRGVTLVKVKGGKIEYAADYFDLLELLVRLGARIELPDGSLLEAQELGTDNR